jgi:O-antigen/teichoic acid export membrane protein
MPRRPPITSPVAARPHANRLKFFRDLAALASGHAVSKILGFFAFAVLARTLDRDDYGAIEYLVGLSVFFATLVECGLGTVGVRCLAHRAGDLPRLAAQIPMARLGLAVICVPLMVLVAMPTVPDPAVRRLVWLFALSLLAVPWRQDWLLQATGRITEASGAHAVRVIVFALLVLITVRGPMDVLFVGWAEIASVTAMSLYCVVVQHARVTSWRMWAPVQGLSALVREGALVGLGQLIWTANQYAPLVLAAWLLDGEQTAWFAAANRLIASILTFSYLYYFNLYPGIARASTSGRGDLTYLLTASFRVVAWGGTFVAVALTLLAEPLSALIFGSRYESSAPMLMVMAWILPTTLLSGHARWALIAAGIQSRVAYGQFAGSITIAVLGIPLILALGGRGAALVAVVAAGAVWLVSHVFAIRLGVSLPAVTIALAPGAVAALVIAGVHGLGLAHWSAGLGALAFALAGPLVDRKLLPDITRLSVATVSGSASPETIA